jgi:hypothetical protein
MIFYIGIILVIAAIISLIALLKKMRKPKATAYVHEIKEAFYEKDKMHLRTYPHAQISYTYQSKDYEYLIFLLRRKVQVGDQIMVSFREDSPEKPTMYAPNQEIIVVVVMFAIGIGLMVGSIFVLDYFELW